MNVRTMWYDFYAFCYNYHDREEWPVLQKQGNKNGRMLEENEENIGSKWLSGHTNISHHLKVKS